MKKFLSLLSIGADPEYFIVHKNKTYFPPFMFTTGTKEKAEQIEGLKDFSLLTDNLTIEGNIPPGYSKEQFIDHMSALENIIAQRLQKRNCTFIRSDMVTFQNRFLSLPGAKDVGCAPDLNAWTEIYPNIRIRDLEETMSRPERTAGMHIHIGYKVNSELFNDKEDLNRLIAQLFDLFIYIPFYETTNIYSKRNSMYGIREGDLSGFYRNKPYGLECRALGSSFSSSIYLTQIWDRIEAMFNFMGTDQNVHRLMSLAFRLKTGLLDDLNINNLYDIYNLDKEELKLNIKQTKETIYA